VTVQRTHIGKSKVFKKRSGHDEGLQGLLRSLGKFQDLLADGGDRFQKILDVLPDSLDRLAGHDGVQVAGQGPHIRRDGHLVVVEDDDQVLLAVSGPVQAFKSQPGRHGSGADDGHDLESFFFQIPGLEDAGSGGNGCAAVADVEDIIGALLPFREAADAALLTEGEETVRPSGDQFVGIGLMTHIPDDLVPRGIKNLVQGQRQFDGP